ncbi:aminotransferase class IV [Salinibacterium hongtaonis]|uniref:aminotransferase class IV n=1 Tax=Homoserinimonas hongtaonis TaxID=2079791 RepID=UPI000D3D7916|nr:aminotransferase class IV [Salinibacterium hongtaonis]AWB89419.1 hypothetical protein C2138_07600 [Salinibacterium hongtaonis]
MSAQPSLLWSGDRLVADDRPGELAPLVVADSWLVVDGRARALSLHRERFVSSVSTVAGDGAADAAAAVWESALAELPPRGAWFPRVELRGTGADRTFRVLVRPAPTLTRSVTLTTFEGDDPRTTPSIKGASLEALEALRAQARADSGADDIVLLSPLGHIAEGAATALLWWRGDILCQPAEEIERVDSVTARSITALATALGVSLSWETTTPGELDGLEVWAVNALHGPRIVKRWVDGPPLAELPGRLALWSKRLDTLRAALAPAPELTTP